MVINGVNFDNTKNVQNFARSLNAEKILNNVVVGTENQIKCVGDIVNGNGFINGIIVEIYQQNGFYYYVCEYKLSPKARKVFRNTLRNKDIVMYNN